MIALLFACALKTGQPLPTMTPASAVPWVDAGAYPFESHFLEVDGGTMHYVDEGTGPTVLLVHGTPTWSYLWRDLISDLSVDHRVIAMDHIGFGLSDKPLEWDYSPAAHARNVERLVETLDLTDFTLVVHDFGGPIGLRTALDHPDRVSNLVLLNTWMWADDKMARIGKFLSGPVGKYLYLSRAYSPRKMIPYATAKSFEWTDERLAPYLGPFPTPESRMSTWQLAIALNRSSAWFQEGWDNRAQLEGKPMLFVWGMADPAFGEALPRWMEAFPTAEVRKLEGAGHFVQEEQPAAVRDAVRSFLAQHESAAVTDAAPLTAGDAAPASPPPAPPSASPEAAPRPPDSGTAKR